MRKPPEAELPKAPEIPRRLVFNRTKRIGLPLLATVPVLALFGVFGISEGEVGAVTPGVEARLTFPERLRYKVSDRLDLSVKNTGSAPLTRVSVRFEEAYLASFSEVHFTPAPQRITGNAYEVELGSIPPGETQRINVALQGEDYGRHRGAITILVDGAPRSQLSVATLTFP